MAIYVNTNVGGIRGRNQLNNINSNLDTTYQRLSSGLRINSAKDDAAGLAITDRMTSQINGLNQANRNISDGIAFMQTVEGAMDEMGSSLQQIRTLSIQAMNGTNTAEDKAALGAQMFELIKGMDGIATNTKYGGKTILAQSHAAATSVYDGTDVTAGFLAAPFNTVTGGKMTLQIGANGGDTFEVKIADFGMTQGANAPGTTSVLGVLATEFNKLNTTAAFATDNRTKDSATHAKLDKAGIDWTAWIKVVDSTIAAVDSQRSNLGAAQNRLESTMRNQSNVIANQSDARSRIRDTDFAEESAKLSQQSILQQASMSMLMQANARPQMALSLLG